MMFKKLTQEYGLILLGMLFLLIIFCRFPDKISSHSEDPII